MTKASIFAALLVYLDTVEEGKEAVSVLLAGTVHGGASAARCAAAHAAQSAALTDYIATCEAVAARVKEPA